MAGQNYCVVDGCLLCLSLCKRGFQDLLKVRSELCRLKEETYFDLRSTGIA
jgi:hypothetical protein